MKKITLAILASAAMAAGSTAAHAQNFQGPYVGAQAGWNRDEAGQAPWDGYGIPLEESRDAAGGGLYLGYDHLVTPSFVLGLEAGVTAARDDELVRSETGATLTVDPKYSIDASARAGYLLDSATMVYARGGYTNLRVSTSQAGKDGVLRDNANLDGWLAGAGLQRVLTPNLSTRLEYRYSDFSGQGGDVQRHQVLLGASLRF